MPSCQRKQLRLSRAPLPELSSYRHHLFFLVGFLTTTTYKSVCRSAEYNDEIFIIVLETWRLSIGRLLGAVHFDIGSEENSVSWFDEPFACSIGLVFELFKTKKIKDVQQKCVPSLIQFFFLPYLEGYLDLATSIFLVSYAFAAAPTALAALSWDVCTTDAWVSLPKVFAFFHLAFGLLDRSDVQDCAWLSPCSFLFWQVWVYLVACGTAIGRRCLEGAYLLR